jgi:hypothetical protein
MAGRPRRRARLEAAERGELPELPKPSKPLTEMTAAELTAHTAQLRRALRDDEVRRGRRPPRSMREVEIWRATLPGADDQTGRNGAHRETGRSEGPVLVSDATPEDIAKWMADRLEQAGRLRQAVAVAEIAKRFGEQFTYLNDNGNPAIDKRVLKAFRKITGDTAVWQRWGSCWRKRSEGDAAGRKQE